MKRFPHVSLSRSLLLVLSFLTVAGCSGPSAANNKLRAENQNLQEKIDALEREKAADRATIESLQAKVGTIPTLPQDRLDKLFTVSGLKLGRLTGGERGDSSKSGDTGLKIEAIPLDQDGQLLKAAGSFTVDAFDLNQPGDQQIGHWAFPLETARANWHGSALLYAYILQCPFQQAPAHAELTVKVTFHDELTGREFHQQMVVKVQLPPAAP
jgi:hypothetical protein